MFQTLAENPTKYGVKSQLHVWTGRTVPDWRRRTHSFRFHNSALPMLNGFRFRFFSDISREVSRLAGNRVRKAVVIVESDPDDETKKELVLVIEADTDWKDIYEWEDHLSKKIVEWSDEWPDGVWNDYVENLNYSLMPTLL